VKDPHIHVEKTPMPGFGHMVMRSIITEAIGLVPDLPKTVGTGCGRRRPIAMTTTIPERVTCLGCREYARAQYLTWAGIAKAAAEIAKVEPWAAVAAKATPGELLDEERTYRALAARFAGTR
jgi:hypothetical protein